MEFPLKTKKKKKTKLKIELLYDPAMLLLSIYPEKTIIQNDTWIPMLNTALLQ